MAVAASDSSARSATTAVMAGWSMSRLPNAARCRTCHSASAAAWRMPAAVPSTQSSRVRATISMMVATPRPGSPTSIPVVRSNSTSEEALERFPNLSFSRWIRKTFRVPSGSTRGTRKHDSPCAWIWASTRKASDIGAEQNHLCPVSRYSATSLPAATRCASTDWACVRLARTSEPPCFSVIAMPTRALDFAPVPRSPS